MPYNDNDPRNSPPCPQCAKGIGAARRLVAEPGRMTVSFQCHACSHEWTDRRADAPLSALALPLRSRLPPLWK
jgi:hypothetical protein